ncbi:MAG: hypothetical protein KBG15_15780 [Kofleriaceae bacterium]|nr:hypothetical protein [Kofleriaceae bacterium]
MKASAVLVIIGGLLGLIGFFMPFVALKQDGVAITMSASQFVRGQIPHVKADDKTQQVVLDSADGRAAMQAGVDESTKAIENLQEIKTFIIVVYAVPGVLLLLGAIGFLRQRFGRAIGALCLLLGLSVLGIGALLQSASEGQAGLGVTLLLPAGAAVALGSLIALIKPLRPAADSLPRATAQG